jgi:hypothetical protein
MNCLVARLSLALSGELCLHLYKATRPFKFRAGPGICVLISGNPLILRGLNLRQIPIRREKQIMPWMARLHRVAGRHNP